MPKPKNNLAAKEANLNPELVEPALQEDATQIEPSEPEEKTLVKAIMKKDYSFQISMPSRADIYVTINLKQGQAVTDAHILSALAQTDTSFDPIYE
jgi:hypothetical protein